MWKAYYRYLPFDDKIKTIGIPPISSCNCCDQRKEENVDHILSIGTFACSKWRSAANTLGMFNVDAKNWKVKILRWFIGAHERTPVGVLVGVLPVVITWKLWMRRCKAHTEEVSEDLNSVWSSICF